MSITKLAYQSTTSQWPLVGNSKTQINASPLNCCPSKHVSLKEGWSSSLSVGVEERFVAVVQLLRPLPTLGHHNSCLGLRVDGERQTRPEGHQLGDLLLIDPVQRKTGQQEKNLISILKNSGLDVNEVKKFHWFKRPCSCRAKLGEGAESVFGLIRT